MTACIRTLEPNLAFQETMRTIPDRVANVTGYRFHDETLLYEALTAAGANDDNPDSNRGLAQVGKGFIEFYSLKLGYLSKASPCKLDDLSSSTIKS